MLASRGDRAALETRRFSLASDIVELVVLTADEAFLQTLRDAVGSSRRLWNVATPEKVSDLLLAGSVGIFVLDVLASRDDASQFIAQIKRQFPDLVIIVAGDRASETALAPQISAGVIYRFIHKPMSPGRAKHFAEAAVRKYGEQRRHATAAVPAVRAAGLDRRLVAGAALGLGALVIGAGLFLAHALLHTGPAPLQGSNRQPVAESALATNPADPTARGVRAEVHERLLARAENALLQEHLDEAQAAIDAARAAGVDSGRIAFLTAELGKLRASLSAAQARAPAPKTRSVNASMADGRSADANASRAATPGAAPGIATPAAALAGGPTIHRAPDTATASATDAARPDDSDTPDRLLRSVQDRVAQDRLVEPAGDSAKHYLLALRDTDPANAGLAAAVQDLGDHMVAKARQAVALDQWNAARMWLDEAAGIGYDSADTMAVRRVVDTATAHQSFLANVVSANTLVSVKTVVPIYPDQAQRNKLEGWVELDFTVAATGEVKDIAVHGTSAPGVFDQAARQALSQWRYRPVVRDSKPVEQRARIRIRFTLV